MTQMAKQGYIDKVKDMVTGEARYDYYIGPRGKVEIGKQGTIELISRVISSRLSNLLMKDLWR